MLKFGYSERFPYKLLKLTINIYKSYVLNVISETFIMFVLQRKDKSPKEKFNDKR